MIELMKMNGKLEKNETCLGEVDRARLVALLLLVWGEMRDLLLRCLQMHLRD